MNGAHDLGGMHGFGPVVVEPNEPVFHADWERRTFALNMAMGAWRRWNLDMGRYAREWMPPAEYLTTTYYEHWLFGLELLLEQKGLVDADELARVRREPNIVHLPGGVVEVKDGAMRREDVERLVVHRRRGARLDDPVAPRFKAGGAAELGRRKNEWAEAARNTAHGKPIELRQGTARAADLEQGHAFIAAPPQGSASLKPGPG
jgi:hypothetical protein